MARDWTDTDSINDLHRRLCRVAPDNKAPIPLSVSFENGKWHVDVHVRIARKTEYEISGVHKDLLEAIKRVHWGLDRELANTMYRNASNRRFGVAV